ncbi:MAG: zinc ribbon domain-containing protein [Candidatus Aminicenantes bacterium]|jgi:RNA polymerase subunit RPABC4/transcription elongation factor Spt4|nr:zinc ribbon domain-containing protein [Candidatus Aminicenantes bacterium]
MFFFIGGITPKIKKLEEEPKICPRCGRASLFKVRIDHYLVLFFIPVCPIKKGQPIFLCENCGLEISERSPGNFGIHQEFSSSTANICPACGHPLEKDFHFCPYCGRPLN